MLDLFRTSLVFRTTASVVAVVLFVGVLFSIAALPVLEDREHMKAGTRLDELLQTVENTVSISCFLRDKGLASEVSRGLMKNQVVKSVTIADSDQVLAQEGSFSGSPASGKLIRDVVSPFDRNTTLCQIVLEPNENVIAGQVEQSSRLIVWLLLMQAFAVAATVVLVVWKWITHPIKKISDQLHHLPVEAGATLELSRRYAKDEIARMVDDVNSLITSLVRSLRGERELRQWREREEKRLRTIFDNAETGIFVIDGEGRLSSCNPAFMRILGIAESTLADDKNKLLAGRLGVSAEKTDELIARALAENHVVSEDICISRADGSASRWICIVLSPMEGGMLQGLINDITDRKEAVESANQLAVTDRLTGLANRLGFERKLTTQHDRMAMDNQLQYCVMMIDLDGFKQVNDTFGHGAGDAVLCHVARLIESAIRKTDFVGRLGGDEFVILLEPGISQEGIERIAQKIISTAAEPITVENGHQVRIGASIGIALSDHDGDKNAVVKRADDAMYRAKQEGKNTYRIY